ncbi:MAG: 3-deoxy-D-manno-octulosonic acid transferase [Gemmatimonas sp.]
MSLARLASSTLATVAPQRADKLSRTFIARSGIVEHWTKAARSRDHTRPLVWFHAPSVGEGLQARPIIEALRAERPDVQIAYSFFSPSAEKFAESLKADITGYLPFDSKSQMRAVVDAIAPTALFFVKLDVWPNLVSVAKERGVRVGLLSGTVAPRSGRQGTLSRAFLHDAYASLDVAGAIDQANADRLHALGVPHERLSVTGDTRFDQVWKRAQHVDRQSTLLRALHSDRPTLVAGSTWPSDEAVLLPSWIDIRMRVPHARIIIAAHEPTESHLAPIERWAQQQSLRATRLGALEREFAAGNTKNDTDVVIVDRVGVLGDIYAMADVAFVGGAFHKAGLHSVLEPAAFGVPVLFGPGYTMSREAGLLIERGGARSIDAVDDCARVVGEWLTDATARGEAGARARTFVSSEVGAGRRSLGLCARMIGVES